MLKGKKQLIISIFMGIVIVFGVLTFYSTFSLNNNYRFESLVYDIKDNYIMNISSNTSISLYYKYFEIDNCSIKVVDRNNDEIINGIIPNGSKTILYDTNHNVITSYTNIIKGDYNSDGIVDNNDFYDIGKCLVNNCALDKYLELSVDIDDDNKVQINDLILLDKAVTLGYTGIEIEQDNIILQSGEHGRVVARVQPSYGVNLNVNWSVADKNIATIDESGLVIGHNEGSTTIIATTLDGKYTFESTVKVDNTIQLESYEGVGYVDGKDVVVGIKSIDYEGLTCSVSNSDYATCEIKNKELILKPKDSGEVIITVTSEKYGKVTYKFDIRSVYLNVIPKYLCNTPGNTTFITVSSFNSGNLKFEFGDNEIISSAYMDTIQNRKMLRINFGKKQGRTTLKVTEGNTGASNVVVVDVYYMKLADIGKVASVGEEVSTTIIGDNLGELSCKSSDETIGICRIEGDQLIVTPLKVGMVTVDVYNRFVYESYNEACGNTQFLVVVQE